MAEKDKKKTLTISTGFKKKYNFDSSSTDKKKTYSIPQKKKLLKITNILVEIKLIKDNQSTMLKKIKNFQEGL